MQKKILFLTAEAAPFVTVGGLSQVAYFLPRSLSKRGVDVRVFTPKYGVTKFINCHGKPVRAKTEILGLTVPDGHAENDGEPIICNVLSVRQPGNDAFTYFLENREYFELRANVFGYSDDPTRFYLLSKGCLEWLKLQRERIDAGEKELWWPNAIHCHDWHASYLVELAKTDRRYRDMLRNIPILLTVHNFRYKGVQDYRFVKENLRDDGSAPLEPIKSVKVTNQNILLRGLKYADSVTTVSPTHAREILDKVIDEGLDVVLPKLRTKMHGILNGLDTDSFNPSTNKIIKRKFNAATHSKAHPENKADLQRHYGLPVRPDVPLFAFLGRLAGQKGIDLIVEALPHLLKEKRDMQFIFQGGGEERFMRLVMDLKKEYPEQIGADPFPDFKIPPKIFAGADVMLMPSAFESGGIIALEALRFGCIPLIRRTGGLNDTVTDFDLNAGTGNGFSFMGKNPWALLTAIIEASVIYRQPKLWQKLVRNAMHSVVTWDDAAVQYEKWYDNAIAAKRKK